MPFAFGLQITHAPRWAIQESSLGIPHEEVRIGDGLSASLFGLMPRIAPRPVLLIASDVRADEAATNRRYQALGGANVALWVVPGAGHTAGLRTRPAEYERRTTEFLDRALEVSR